MTYTLLDGTTHFVVSLRDGMITIPMVMTIGTGEASVRMIISGISSG